jgi:cytoskeletal protein CcmA (bactofilin family)
MSPASHFDEMACLLYLDGQFEHDRAREFLQHVDSCASCRALLRALEGEDRRLRAALLEEDEEDQVPQALLARPARAPVPWGWLAAFGFGSAGAYTVWAAILQPVQQQFSQAGFNQGSVLTMVFFSGALWKGWDTMRDLTEILALVTLAVVAFALLRRHWRRFTPVAVVMSALSIALAIPAPAGAAEVHHGDPNYELPAGQQVKTDLFLAGNNMTIDGNVDGDVIAWGQDLIVNGHVGGDVLFFGRELRINGAVDGNIRGWEETMYVNGTVGKNLMAWCSSLQVGSKTQIRGSVTAGAAEIELDGRVGRDVMAMAGDITLNGPVGGSVTLGRSGNVLIESNADITGTTKITSRHEPHVDGGAKLATPLQFTQERTGPDYSSPRYYWHQVLTWGAAFVFGIVMMLLVPPFFANAVHATNRVGESIGIGALILIVTPVAALIACCTIVGLGIGIATFILYLVAVYASQVFFGAWIGEKLLGASAGIGSSIGQLALGLAIFRVLRMLPYIRVPVLFLAFLWGLGAIGLALYKTTRRTQLAVPVAAG